MVRSLREAGGGKPAFKAPPLPAGSSGFRYATPGAHKTGDAPPRDAFQVVMRLGLAADTAQRYAAGPAMSTSQAMRLMQRSNQAS